MTAFEGHVAWGSVHRSWQRVARLADHLPNAPRSPRVTKRNDMTDLRQALAAQHEADVRQREARAHADAMIAHEIASGVSYHEVARVTLEVRLGRPPTPDECRPEVVRLRQCRCRLVTGRHGNRAKVGLKIGDAVVGSESEVSDMTRLTKRITTTTTEEYGIDEKEKEDVECADDAAEGDDAAEADEDADEDEEEDEDEDADEE
jgi:hypothetical protein